MNNHKRLIAMIYAACLLSACAGAKTTRGGSGAPRKPAGSGLNDVSRAIEAEPDARGRTARAVPELRDIRFAYDSDGLDAEARSALKENATYLNARPTIDIQIAGHCDERGTEAYNLALGQRRARTTRDFYRLMGVNGDRIATISYGRERPTCREATESCWAANRRAQTLVMAGGNLAGSPRPDNGHQ